MIALAIGVLMVGAILAGALMESGGRKPEPMTPDQVQEEKRQGNGLLLGVVVCAVVGLLLIGGAG
jgi:hypothetical protein